MPIPSYFALPTNPSEERAQFVATDPLTVLPPPAPAPFARARQEASLQVVEEAHERALEAPIAITQRELLSLAPEVRTKVADVTVKKRVPYQPVLEGLMLKVTADTARSILHQSTIFRSATSPTTYPTLSQRTTTMRQWIRIQEAR